MFQNIISSVIALICLATVSQCKMFVCWKVMRSGGKRRSGGKNERTLLPDLFKRFRIIIGEEGSTRQFDNDILPVDHHLAHSDPKEIIQRDN